MLLGRLLEDDVANWDGEGERGRGGGCPGREEGKGRGSPAFPPDLIWEWGVGLGGGDVCCGSQLQNSLFNAIPPPFPSMNSSLGHCACLCVWLVEGGGRGCGNCWNLQSSGESLGWAGGCKDGPGFNLGEGASLMLILFPRHQGHRGTALPVGPHSRGRPVLCGP